MPAVSYGEQMDRGITQMVEAGLEGNTIMDETEAKVIRAALTCEGGNQCRAARRLGWHRNTLSRKMAEHKISGREFRYLRKPPANAFVTRERLRLAAIGIACFVVMLMAPLAGAQKSQATIRWTNAVDNGTVSRAYYDANRDAIIATVAADGTVSYADGAKPEDLVRVLLAQLAERDRIHNACDDRAQRLASVASACMLARRRDAYQARYNFCELNGSPRPMTRAPHGGRWALVGDPAKCLWTAVPIRPKKASR